MGSSCHEDVPHGQVSMSDCALVDVRKACAQAAAQLPARREFQDAARDLTKDLEGAQRVLQDELPFVASPATLHCYRRLLWDRPRARPPVQMSLDL